MQYIAQNAQMDKNDPNTNTQILPKYTNNTQIPHKYLYQTHWSGVTFVPRKVFSLAASMPI